MKTRLKIVKPFCYQGCTFDTGIVRIEQRVEMPCTVERGIPLFDREHFIDPETDEPWVHGLDGLDGMTDTLGNPITSLEGYLELR